MNKKQNSREAIAAYHRNNANVHKAIPMIDAITKTVVEANQSKEFALALEQHEIIMSNVLELTTIKETLFQDFDKIS